MKIGIVGVGKSSNVGDQLIAKCLGMNILNISKEFAVEYYDLYEGRFDVEFSQPQINFDGYRENKEKKKTYYAPRFLRLLTSDIFSRRKTNAMIKSFIEDKDLIIIGGGHLLIDNYGSFALKIRRVLSLCEKNEKRVVLWSVGVGKLGWIWKQLLSKKISNIPIFSRDHKSAEVLSLVTGRADISAIIDPAFFSDNLIKNRASSASKGSKEKKIATLFIMDPYEMVRHSGDFFTRDFVAAWWIELITLLKLNYNIIIANNGSPNDFFFIEKYIKGNVPDVVVLDRALNYRAIIDNVDKSDCVIAQRLHAIIPSIALGKSVLALKWDNKVESILKDIGMEQCMITYNHIPSHIAKKIHSSEVDVDNTLIQKLKNHHINLLKRIIKNESN